MDLGEVVVECYNRTSQVKRRIENIGQVIEQAVFIESSGNCDTISFRKNGWVQLLLLWAVRLEDAGGFDENSGYVPPFDCQSLNHPVPSNSLN